MKEEKLYEFHEAISILRLISSPMRPDGTWNRDRKACQLLAENFLIKFDKMNTAEYNAREHQSFYP